MIGCEFLNTREVKWSRFCGGETTSKIFSFVGVRRKGKESNEKSRESAKSNDGWLWLGETIDLSELDAVLPWRGRGDGNNSFKCVYGRPKPNLVVN
jgi:hypothetical protein